MARLKSVLTGVTVSVSDATAAQLDSEWVDESASPRSETPDKSWKVAELKAYAEEKSVDLGDATKKEDLLAAIELHNESSGNE